MTRVLQTKVLPIECNGKTRRKAKKIKRQLNQYPDFFKAFLKEKDMISCVDKNASVYIPSGESILEHLEDINFRNAENILLNRFSNEESKSMILLYLLNEKYDGCYEHNNNAKEVMENATAFLYYCDNKDYAGLHDYILNPTKEKMQKAFTWLEDTSGFALLNRLLDNQLSLLENNFFDDDDIYEELQKMYDTIEEETCDMEDAIAFESKGESINFKEITYPMSKEESISLAKEFFACVDPSLSWLKTFYDADKVGALIDDNTPKQAKKSKWCCFKGINNQWYINAPWTHTLEDPISLVHEFVHYIVFTNQKDENPNFKLCEFPSIFFETLMCKFLLNKGYPKEEVTKYIWNRNIGTIQNCRDIEDIIVYLLKKVEGQELTLKKEEEELNKFFPDEQEKNTDYIKDCCNNSLHSLIDSSSVILYEYPYILGKKYSDLAILTLPDNEKIVNDMVSITKELNTMTEKEALQKLNLILKDEKIKVK